MLGFARFPSIFVKMANVQNAMVCKRSLQVQYAYLCIIGISEMKLGLRSWLIKPYLDKPQTLEDNIKALNEKVQLLY